jgi:hypothetical protein
MGAILIDTLLQLMVQGHLIPVRRTLAIAGIAGKA